MTTDDPHSAPSGASPTHAFSPSAIMARAVDAQSTAPSASVDKVLAPEGAPQSTGRRAALLGGAMALLAPLAPRPATATQLSGDPKRLPRVAEADADFARLADEIDRTLDGAAYAMQPADDEEEQDRRIGLAVDRMDRMVVLPAAGLAGLAGVKAKAKAYLDLWSYDVDTADLSRSLAEDAERVCAEVLA